MECCICGEPDIRTFFNGNGELYPRSNFHDHVHAGNECHADSYGCPNAARDLDTAADRHASAPAGPMPEHVARKPAGD